tara:strand:- start:101 stop:2053 length:1953 start_codon:yes stop_codon:yes gene_type:complete
MNKLLWSPTEAQIQNTQAWSFIQEVNKQFKKNITDFHELYKWSIDFPELFWSFFWQFTSLNANRNSSEILKNKNDFLKSEWFADSELNFAENLLSKRDNSEAIVFWGEDQFKKTITYKELYNQVARLSHWLQSQGVVKGDIVAGFLPNMPEAVIAMIAASSIGAIWTSCSPDFGVQGVLDRFGQVEPKIFICVDAYLYNGKSFDCIEKNREIITKLPTIEKTILVRYINKNSNNLDLKQATNFDQIVSIKDTPELFFEHFKFNDPLYILFSSGTTGVPKCIVHGAGGTLIQHKKEHNLHCDIDDKDRVFYFSTCGWMMWNWLVSGLASGATLMLYDGSPALKSNQSILFDFAEKERFTVMGVSAKFLDSCRKINLKPKTSHNLNSLRLILSTGSVLSSDCFNYVYDSISKEVCLSSISGGTDIVSCFVLGSPSLSVYQGELQTRGLGMAVEVWNANGQSIKDEKGELVCTKTFPSKPIMFWNDEDMSKYRSTYFSQFPNVWQHGDYVKLMGNNGMIFYGRSDTTLNRGGVRIGTAEIYRQVELLDEVLESIVVEQTLSHDSRIVLFVKLASNKKLSQRIKEKIINQIRINTTPRHVPDMIIQVSDIPRTKSGKIVETAVHKAINNLPIDNIAALENPKILEEYYNLNELE